MKEIVEILKFECDYRLVCSRQILKGLMFEKIIGEPVNAVAHGYPYTNGGVALFTNQVGWAYVKKKVTNSTSARGIISYTFMPSYRILECQNSVKQINAG